METTKVKPIDSQVKVSLPPQQPIQRLLSCKAIADDMTSRITAKLIGYDDLYDPKTQQFLTEKELVKKGAVFMTISYNKALVIGKDTVKKCRSTKEPIPYNTIIAESKYQVIANVNWESYINKRGNKDFIPAEKRANGVMNYADCRAIGETKAGNMTINGVAFRSLEAKKYIADDNEVDKDTFEREYGKVASKASKQKEADKHGIDVRFDPKYRTTRIDSCKHIRAFGFEYKPIENHCNVSG